MAKKLSSVVGIDIGSQSIKVAEIKLQGRDPVVTALGVVATPEGAVDHTGVYNSDAVAMALKQVLGETGVTSGQAVVSIAGQTSVLVRTLDVPRMNPTELKEHMQWEINRNIPFAESTVVSDYQPLPDEDPTSPNMEVVMAIAPQSAVDTMISCVKKAGRQVAAIDVEPLALARSIQMSYDDTLHGQTVCLIDMGARTTAINIYKSGRLMMPRQIPIGGEMFTKAIADGLSVTTAEAEQIKVEKAWIPDSAASAASTAGATAAFQPYNPFSDEPAAAGDAGGATPADPGKTTSMPAPIAGDAETTKIYNAFSPVLEEFVAEIRRSIDYFKSRGGDVSHVELCGGGTRLKGLAQYLHAVLGAECDNYDSLRRLNLNMRKVAPGFAEEHSQEFAVAVGNGLHILYD